jgi:hypothetical protein
MPQRNKQKKGESLFKKTPYEESVQEFTTKIVQNADKVQEIHEKSVDYREKSLQRPMKRSSGHNLLSNLYI